VTSDVFLAKLTSIERCLARIRTVTGGDPATVRNLDVQEIVLLNLQRAIQAVLYLAAHVIASNDWGLPDSQRQHITILEQHGVVATDLADRLRAMVGFRNIAVHEYQALEPAILERIVERHLGDLEDYADAVRRSVSPA
jgi:uncharacterized protein YutE (UPF0331/DUF86 family)